MSDRVIPHLLYTADPTAPPAISEYFEAMKADLNGALWIRPIAAGTPQTADSPDSDAIDPATVWAFYVRSFNYIWDPVGNVWDREQRYAVADDMPNIEARSVISFSMGYDGANWDRLRIGAGNVDAVAPETLGLLKILARLTGINDAGTFDRLRSGEDNADADAAVAQGILKVISRLTGYNGATFDRLRSGDTNSDGQATVAAGALESLGRLFGFNGLTWDRIRSITDSTDAQGLLTTGLLATLSKLQGFNGATFDRLRTTVDNSDAVAAGVIGLLGTMSRGLVWNGSNFMRDWKSADFNAVTSGNVGAASNSILAASATRRYLLIQNTHATQTLYINFGAAASPTTLAIIAGGNYEPLIVPTDEIFAYGSGAATTYVIANA